MIIHWTEQSFKKNGVDHVFESLSVAHYVILFRLEEYITRKLKEVNTDYWIEIEDAVNFTKSIEGDNDLFYDCISINKFISSSVITRALKDKNPDEHKEIIRSIETRRTIRSYYLRLKSLIEKKDPSLFDKKMEDYLPLTPAPSLMVAPSLVLILIGIAVYIYLNVRNTMG
ncbi:hypothetical protein [Paenibacillus sp. Y412MC10]|uniref:hypothetical protein n=1 Tax=Geobacillus sp. (strain Y412MC10) TaxID=481743 RepID=UPI0011AB4B43|nr:hypothetical protein [Paenibacillus sp. Y412MC10]